MATLGSCEHSVEKDGGKISIKIRTNKTAPQTSSAGVVRILLAPDVVRVFLIS
jgi:hypothetical protein